MKNDKTELNVNLIINNLNIGDTLSYKDLCEKLNQPYYRGNQKNAQLKEFKRYFNFENVNRKIIITDIYDESLDPQARAVPKNAIYVKYISCVLLDHLSKQDGYRIYITKTKLWLLLGIITENYIKYNKNRKELKKLSNKMTDFEIREFFKRCNNNFPKIITSSLNSLQRRNLIKYSEPYVIVEKDSNGKIEHREAMDSEVAYIIKTVLQNLPKNLMYFSQDAFCSIIKHFGQYDMKKYLSFAKLFDYRDGADEKSCGIRDGISRMIPKDTPY